MDATADNGMLPLPLQVAWKPQFEKDGLLLAQKIEMVCHGLGWLGRSLGRCQQALREIQRRNQILKKSNNSLGKYGDTEETRKSKQSSTYDDWAPNFCEFGPILRKARRNLLNNLPCLAVEIVLLTCGCLSRIQQRSSLKFFSSNLGGGFKWAKEVSVKPWSPKRLIWLHNLS